MTDQGYSSNASNYDSDDSEAPLIEHPEETDSEEDSNSDEEMPLAPQVSDVVQAFSEVMIQAMASPQQQVLILPNVRHTILEGEEGAVTGSGIPMQTPVGRISRIRVGAEGGYGMVVVNYGNDTHICHLDMTPPPEDRQWDITTDPLHNHKLYLMIISQPDQEEVQWLTPPRVWVEVLELSA